MQIIKIFCLLNIFVLVLQNIKFPWLKKFKIFDLQLCHDSK